MGNISINGITGGAAPYTIKVYQVGSNSPVFTDTTNTSNYTRIFAHTNGESYYAVVEKDGCTSYTSGNSTLNCSTCNRTNNVFYNIKGKQGGISNSFSESEIYQYLCSGYNGASGTTYAINNFNLGGIVYHLPCNFNDCSPSSHNGWYLAYLDSANYCTSGAIAPPNCGIKGVRIVNGVIQEIIDADTNPVCNLQFEILESAIGNCESTYTVTISKTSGNTPAFIRYGWSIINDVSTVNNWQLSNMFVVNSNNINRYFFAEYTVNNCTPIPKLAGVSQRNCNTCSLTTGSITYSCNNNSSSTYTVNFLISGGTGNYKYSTDNGTTWSNTTGNVTTSAIKGQTIIIANSDSTCQTSVNLDNNTNLCELCFNLTYDSVNVVCVSGSTERKRVTMEISNNITSGCPSGDYQYSNDNGSTWTITTSSFNKIYDGYSSNTILLRYSLYPSKIWTVNAPAFNIPSCNEGYYYVTNSCSCQFNGGV
jgi:hypothetical protein